MNGVNIARFTIAVALCMIVPMPTYSQAALQGMDLSEAPPSAPQGPLTKSYKYYDDGKMMSCSEHNRAGRLVTKTFYHTNGKVEKIERYDEAGNKIEESNYDDSGNLSGNIGGWAAKRWVYKDGILRVESTYGPNGRLTERCFYNEAGDLVNRQYVGDGNIDPYEEFNRGVVVTHETDQFYNRYGDETGSETTEVDDPDDMFGGPFGDPFWD